MATYGWGTDHPVGDWLFEEGHRFDFFQAVRLLETMFSNGVPVGESADPEREPVCFAAHAGLAFPATDIAEIQPLDSTLKQLGLAYSDLTPELAQQLGLDDDHKGVVITDVHPSSAAFREAQLRPRMLITGITPLYDGDGGLPAPVYPVQNGDDDAFLVLSLRGGGGGLPAPVHSVQSVRELEKIYQSLTPGTPFSLGVELTGKPGMKRVELTKPEARRALMRVNFLGLAGHLGPLPAPYTELIMDRSWQQDTAFRDFLDIFNHRLISLLYRVRKHHHIGLDVVAPERSHVASYLYALSGMGTKGLQDCMDVDDRALLRYTGLLTQKPRSAIGLEAMLHDYFRLPVHVGQFVGCWRPLEAHQTTRIATSADRPPAPGRRPIQAQNNRLGDNVVLGSHVWQQNGHFDVHLGPLSLPQFLDFLPQGSAYRALSELTRFYVNRNADFNAVLTLKPEDAPVSRLGSLVGPRLGWTSWLGTPPEGVSDEAMPDDHSGRATPFQVTVKPREAPPELQKMQHPLIAALTPSQIRHVLDATQQHARPESSVIAQEGDPADSFFVVLTGSVHVLRSEPGKGDVIHATLGEGDFFGEMTLQGGKRRSTTFVTAEPSEILELTHEKLRQVMDQHPAIARAIEVYRRKQSLHGSDSPYMKLAQRLHALRSPLFGDLSMEGLCEVAQGITLYSVSSEVTVTQQGRAGNALYVIAGGTARMERKRVPDGRSRTTTTLRKGAVFGERAVLLGTPLQATVTTTSRVELIEWTRANLARVVARYPPVEHALQVFYQRRFAAKTRTRHGA